MVFNTSGTGNDLEARFAHLIQPIRNLTKNWDVDIASHLEDYLEEIESISITFDDGATTLNFAEAALLIQGSACVYSKKVEYLYSLVYQVLDLLSSKKKLQQAGSLDAEGNDKDATFAKRKTHDDEFLSLDDIKEHRNIDLRHDDSKDGNVHVVPRTPMALVPKHDSEKGENPLLSHKGEVLGSRNDFKMNTCCIHPTGTLLLDMSHLSLLDLSFRNKPTSTPYPNKAPGGTVGCQAAPTDAMATSALNNGGGGIPLNMSFDDAGIDIPEPEDPLPPPVDEQEQRDDQQGLRRSERTAKKPVARQPEKHKWVDPWISLDPHQADFVTEKGYKKQKTFRMPPSLESEACRKRKRKAATTSKIRQMSLADFCTQAYYSRASKFPKNPLKTPSFPEFEHLYWAEFKRRQAKLRNDRKQMLAQGHLQDLLEEQEEDQEEENVYNDMPAGAGDPDDLDDPGPHVDFQLPDILDLGPMDPDLQNVLPLNTDFTQALEDAPVISSYEELVRRHVEGFLASAQQYEQVTELSKRVAEWEDKILPKLEEEEEHGAFDIHKYGTTVLDHLSKKTPDPEEPILVPFREVVENKPCYDVCRLFLSTLQLANSYNVEIAEPTSVLDTAVDTMTLKLLTTRRHFEELVDYRAPSIEH